MYNDKKSNKLLSEIDLDNEQHNTFTLTKINLGIEGEKMILYFLIKFGLLVLGNDLESGYVNQRGADIIHKGLNFYAEVKNLSGLYYLSAEWCKEHVIPRFPKNSRISVVFVSHDRFTKEAKKLLKEHDIYIVEWGKQLTGQNWKKAISTLYRKFYPIYIRYKRLFDKYMNKEESVSSSVCSTISTTEYNTMKNIRYNDSIIDRYRKKPKNWVEVTGKTEHEQPLADEPRIVFRSWSEITGID